MKSSEVKPITLQMLLVYTSLPSSFSPKLHTHLYLILSLYTYNATSDQAFNW